MPVTQETTARDAQDSDDTWHPDRLEKQVRLLEETRADMCFCGMNRIAANGNQFHFPVHPFHKEHAVEEFLAENRASTQTMLMKRKVWETLRFDENIRRYQDWDFGIRAANTFDLVYMPEALVESEVGADSISARVASYQHLMHLYKKHLDLYEQYPKSMAVMNRRMGKRVHPTDPALAAKHFKKSLKLSKNPYDLKYWIMDSIRSSALSCSGYDKEMRGTNQGTGRRQEDRDRGQCVAEWNRTGTTGRIYRRFGD